MPPPDVPAGHYFSPVVQYGPVQSGVETLLATKWSCMVGGVRVEGSSTVCF